MRLIASGTALVLASTILFGAMVLLTTSRVEYCGQPEPLRPRIDAITAIGTPSPTLAPPQKVVFLRVETDKPGLEVRWAEN
jgi:hypothetical protein